MSKKIAIIGAGNLGTAIATGLTKTGYIKATNITITRRNLKALDEFERKGFVVTSNNETASKNADIVILAVKPFQVKEVLTEITGSITSKTILISVVTGISMEEIESIIGKKSIVFRAMPNTAIAIAESMTCISANEVNESATQEVKSLFECLGQVTFINENLMNAATVLGACGTAFAMRFIRANIQGGIEIGFDSKTASLIAAQTVKGAAELLLQNGTHPEQEIDKVTTPKGCTIAGLNEMEHRGFSSSLIKGIATSYNKIEKG